MFHIGTFTFILLLFIMILCILIVGVFLYYYSKKDKYNFIHSIDNCVVFYYLFCSVDFFLNVLSEKGSLRKTFWENRDLSKSTKYNFYRNHVHYDDGIYIKVGRYPVKDVEKLKYDSVIPCVQIEVNPNKHYEQLSFRELLDFIKEYCTEGMLLKCDYAIDIPAKLNDVQIFSSRKEKGLYKGTRYFGQRNKHGYCKIYDKTKESGLEFPLTRVEHTLDPREKPSFEKFYVLRNNESASLNDLSNNNRTIVELCLRLRSLGGEYEDILDDYMSRSSRYRLESCLFGGYDLYEYDLDILDDLYKKMYELFYINYTDDDGFLHVPDEPLPFD